MTDTISRLESENERLRLLEISLRQIIIRNEEALGDKSNQIAGLRKGFDDNMSKLEERIVYLQMQVNTLKSKLESKEKEFVDMKKNRDQALNEIQSSRLQLEEKEIQLRNCKDVSQALQKQLIDLERELKQAKDTQKVDGDRDVVNQSLQKELLEAQNMRDVLSRRLKELEDYRLKTDGQLLRLSTMSSQIDSLAAELEDKASLLTRLRAEAQSNERNHAMRTAMVSDQSNAHIKMS